MKRRLLLSACVALAVLLGGAPARAQGGLTASGVLAQGGLPTPLLAIYSGDRPVQARGVRAVSAYPNPADEELTVRFTLERAQRVDLAVFDLLGRRLRGWDLGVLAPGEQAHRLDLSGLPPGLYVVRLSGDAGARATIRVTRRPAA